MRIEKLQYYDEASDWRLEATQFSDLTLLVGVSGVGKTKILQAIWAVKQIAEGSSHSGVHWELEFIGAKGDKYGWRGRYENTMHMGIGRRPQIISEQVTRNGATIAERSGSEILFRGTRTPKLSPFESLVSIFSQEADMSSAYDGFKRVARTDSAGLSRPFSTYSYEVAKFRDLSNSRPSLEEIKECELNPHFKAALTYKLMPGLFVQIKERFIDVFPQVEDIRIEVEEWGGIYPLKDIPTLQIKEKGVRKWIPQRDISAGMLKTFMHICEMLLWPDGTVVLIDEFENSLGVNCLDVLTEDLLQENKRLQFIVTSHHPYIINNISPKYWKLVMRQGGRVFTQDAAALRLDSSRHKAFTQLLNHERYLEGIIAA